MRLKYLTPNIYTLSHFGSSFPMRDPVAHTHISCCCCCSFIPPRLFHRFYLHERKRYGCDYVLLVAMAETTTITPMARHRWYSIKTKQWLNRIKWCVCEHQSSGHYSYNSCDSWWWNSNMCRITYALLCSVRQCVVKFIPTDWPLNQIDHTHTRTHAHYTRYTLDVTNA